MVISNGDGLYKDKYESDVYTYRGYNPNNYINFNNELWRIISFDSKEGTIKIIKNDILDEMPYDTEGIRYNDGTYCDFSEYGCNIWGSINTLYDMDMNPLLEAAYNLRGGNKYNLPATEADINIFLNTEYYNLLENSNMIVDDIYKVGIFDIYNTNNILDDLKQVNSIKWKGKIGFIDVTEYVRASTNPACVSVKAYYSEDACRNNTENNYLNINENWWTITPFSYEISGYILRIQSNGRLVGGGVSSNRGIRPVINLSSSVKIISGDGSQSSPYQISL